MIDIDDIRPVLLGHYTMPKDSRFPGQTIVVCAYLIHHPERLVLFDTGIAEGHAEAERTYAPIVRRPGRPIFAQVREYEAAAEGGLDYTLPGLFDFQGSKLELHDGDADIASVLRAIPPRAIRPDISRS